MSEEEIQELLRTVQEFTMSFKEHTAANQNLTSENARLKQKLEHMNELLLLAQRARFGQSSEKREYVLQGGEQMRLFNEAEQLQEPKAPEPTPETLVAAHTRKPKRPLDELVKDLPSKKVILEPNADQLACDACGSKLTAIGEKFLRRELNVIPRQVEIIEYYTRTYVCKAYEEQTEYASFYTVKTIPPLLKHSLASPSSFYPVIYSHAAAILDPAPPFGDFFETAALAFLYFGCVAAGWLLLTVLRRSTRAFLMLLACAIMAAGGLTAVSIRAAASVDVRAGEIAEAVSTAAAAGKVYANERPVALKCAIPAFSWSPARDGAFAALDKVSAVAARDRILRDLINAGFRVAELSQDYVLYSNDEAVIEALRRAGCTFSEYYPFALSTDNEASVVLENGTTR